MRRKDKEITDRAEIEQIIARAQVCRLGLIDQQQPYIVPLNFGYQDNCLYFHSAPEGKKIALLRKNQRVCFEIDIDTEIIAGERSCSWTTRYRSIIGWGKAEILESVEEKNDGLQIIVNHYSTEPSGAIPAQAVSRVAVIKVTIEEISGKKSGYRSQ